MAQVIHHLHNSCQLTVEHNRCSPINFISESYEGSQFRFYRDSKIHIINSLSVVVDISRLCQLLGWSVAEISEDVDEIRRAVDW